MKSNLITILFIALLAGVGLYFYSAQQEEIKREETAQIILEKIEEVSKLILVEGTFAEIYTYKQSENLLFNLIPVQKKVLIIVKAKASVGYDLQKVDYVVNPEAKTVVIRNIPEVEIIIAPNIQYYDIEQSAFYPLEAKDLTTINSRAVALIEKQVKQSTLPGTAEDRLQEVLEQIIFTGENLGWTVVKE